MSDAPQNQQMRIPTINGQAPGPFSPPVQSANQLGVAMSLSDIAVTFGQTRQMIDPATGTPGGQAAIEWLMTVTLAAPVARNLLEALTRALEVYETNYGRIPKDATGTSSTIMDRTKEK